jgi:hypothetical protein
VEEKILENMQGNMIIRRTFFIIPNDACTPAQKADID